MSDSISEDLFNLLVSKDFEVKTFDSQGKPVLDVNDGSIFRFDFTVGKNNYGTAVILIDDESNFELFFGDNIGKTMRGKDKEYWFDFLYILKQFSIRHLKKFKPSNMNKMKYSMQGIAAIKEGLFEGKWSGTSKSSYNPQPNKTRIIARHNKRLGEEDARFRNIKTLFVENGDGERFKLPFVNIGGARAMARHVSEGGNPYDQFGLHISETVKDIATMGGFLRIRSLNESEDTQQIVEVCRNHYKDLRDRLKKMSSKRNYKKYLESWNPTEINENEAITNALKNTFINYEDNVKVENAIPLISRLQQMTENDKTEELTEKNETENMDMKELDEFTEWADDVVETSITNTPFATEQLAEKFKEPIPVGVNALNAQEIVDEVIDDPDLMEQLSEIAESDPEADARPIIVDWLYENGYDYVADRLEYEPEQDVAGGDQVDDFIDDVEADEVGMQEGYGEVNPMFYLQTSSEEEAMHLSQMYDDAEAKGNIIKVTNKKTLKNIVSLANKTGVGIKLVSQHDLTENTLDETWGSERGPDGEPSINDWLTSPIDSFKKRTNISKQKYADKEAQATQGMDDDTRNQWARDREAWLGHDEEYLDNTIKNRAKPVGEDVQDITKLAGL